VLSSSYVDSYIVSSSDCLLVNSLLYSCFLTRSTLKKYLVNKHLLQKTKEAEDWCDRPMTVGSFTNKYEGNFSD
jgi:hypothetical protein